MSAKKQDTQQLLQHWRESVPDDRLAHLIRDVARAQMRALQQRLAPHGVSFGHWTFLRILWIKDGLTQRELSELAGVMEPTTFTAAPMQENAKAEAILNRMPMSGRFCGGTAGGAAEDDDSTGMEGGIRSGQRPSLGRPARFHNP